MRPLRSRALAAMTGVAALSLALVAPTAFAAPGAPGPAGDNGLGKHDRELLAQAKVQGKKTITLIVSTGTNKNSTVASAVAALGGSVGYRDDAIGYLRVTVPVAAAAQVAAIAGVEAVDVDEVVPLEDPRPDGLTGPVPYAPPSASTPKSNPYMPIRDTGAVDFVTAHPTWDGRGTTIAIIDSGIDLAHPALQTTTTGERKIVDWVTATDPTFTGTANNDSDPTWIQMGTQVSATPGFTSGGVAYTAPKAGSYRFGVFDERHPDLGGELGNDVNRDGNPAGSSGLFGVLWDATSNTVWVDTNQNGSFADESGMTDYKVRYDVGYFGTDRADTAYQDRMPFVVQTDGKNKVVNIGIVSGAHGSHVAGITAANGMFGGAMTGAAPGAKLVSVRVCLFVGGCTSHALLEGMILAAKQMNVDVINMSIGGLPALNDGNNARAALYDKLIETYKVQMFISAGNSGAGINTIGDPSVASKVMSVGSYITNDTWKSNYGSSTTKADNIHPYSSRGPREDGGFKPQILAPGSAVSTVPTWQSPAGACLPYDCPPGYAMFNGTSMASPQAAGAAALLVSAAKATGTQYKPAQLRQAVNSSARFIDGYGAYEQGNGLMNVPAAWALLATQAKVVDVQARVAVNTVISGFLATPNVGTGIYDREGVKAGDSYVRTYTFTRTSGGGGTITYAVKWVGNDGTFASARSVALPLNTPVSFPVTVTAASSGIHSAILNLDDPANPGVEAQTMNTIVAADQFTAANGYAVTKSGTIARNQSTSHFFKVPANTPAFKVDLTGGGTTAGAGQIRFLRFHPYGVGIDANSTPYWYNPPVPTCVGTTQCSAAAAVSRTVSNPQPGVWEVAVEMRRTSDAIEAPYSITASVLGATVTPIVIPTAQVGVPVTASATATNIYGTFTGRMVGGTLGSALRATPTISTGQMHTTTVDVPAGASSLRATIGSTSDAAADLDLYVYGPTGALAGQSADGDSEESVTIGSPAPGRYTVVVDGYSVPAGSTTYSYVDVVTAAQYGSVSLTDANAERLSGASWTVPVTVTAGAVPATGRVLLGAVRVATSANVVVGTGDVLVQAVTP